jgi:hypothetical protein
VYLMLMKGAEDYWRFWFWLLFPLRAGLRLGCQVWSSGAGLRVHKVAVRCAISGHSVSHRLRNEIYKESQDHCYKGSAGCYYAQMTNHRIDVDL